MNKYKVSLNGSNFVMVTKGPPASFGFFATRYVEAEDFAAAGERAIAQLRNEAEIFEMCINDEGDPPLIHVESVQDLDSFDGVSDFFPELAFYREDDDE